MAAIKALEQWCKMQCDGYRDVAITNMTSSFKNGLAFCALIHKYRPDLIDYDSLSKEDVFENNHLAFRVAEEKLGIPALLDAEDMVALRVPDRLSILTYVSQYHNYFKGHSPICAVKRPAEGSKEEPSEKKNLPVVATTFVSKTAIENCLPAALMAETSTKLDKAAVQKTENGNKTGTLNSKCVACKYRVHLVQRHFVDGKLFHRSCFKCSECSALLHAGAYKAEKDQDTFTCKSHSGHNSCKPSTSGAVVKNGPSCSVLQPKDCSRTKPMPHPCSTLTTSVSVTPKPVDAVAPTGRSWTFSAQKTQEARQRFFQAAPTNHREPPGLPKVSDRPKSPMSPAENSRCRPATLLEENCNNNNARHFVIRSAKRRFEGDYDVGMRHNECNPCLAENQAGQLSTRHNNNIMEPLCSKAISDNRRPTPVAKDPVLHDWRSTLKPVKKDPGLRCPDSGPASVEQHIPELTLQLHSNISFTKTKSPSAPIPVDSPVNSVCYIKPSSQELEPELGDWNLNDERSSSPITSLSGGPTRTVTGSKKIIPNMVGDSCSSDAKRGKYLSPTNAFMPEMRQPTVKSAHIVMGQIVKELQEIETKMSVLEKEGVVLERKLRSYETEGEGDILMDPLMVDWFNLIRKKQLYIRKESELIYIVRTQDLEHQQPGVEGELRMLLAKPDHLKSNEDQCQELLDRLLEIVNERNAIVEGLDEDRLREVEEDQQLHEMMQNLELKQSKNKRTSSISKLFRRRNKKELK